MKSRELAEEPGKQFEHELAPAWLSVEEACHYVGVSHTTFYEKLMPKLDVRKLGKRALVRRVSIDRFMDGLPAQPAKGLRRKGALIKQRAG